MKVFISFVPQQENLKDLEYAPQGNQRLEYQPTSFPIMAAINGYAEMGEEIRVILLVPDHPNCKRNAELFRAEFGALREKKGLRCPEINVVEVPFDDAVSTHIATFQKLIDRIQDQDDIYACITYGNMPALMVELMALRYARLMKKDAYISCIVYGQVDVLTNEAKIYDETALAHLDDIVRMLVAYGDADPERTLNRCFSLL